MKTSNTNTNYQKEGSHPTDSLLDYTNKVSIFHSRFFETTNIEEVCAEHIRTSVMKRIIDVVGSVVFLLFFGSWIFLLVAIAIKLDTRGSVFFIQRRRGEGGKLYTCLKFRTMLCSSQDVDANGRYLQAKTNDPRITGVGSFLRRYSLDELPQFINVLLGDMSLVGPRPHPEPLNVYTETRLPHYNKRHLIKPGITGLAQIRGYRGHTMHNFELMERRVMYDLIYIRKWSIILDLRILLATVFNYQVA